MTVRITGELPPAEIEATLYAVHFWARDTRNHRFEREAVESSAETLWPKCTRGKRVPQRTCFRDELSEELGDDRDTSRDCRTCFSTVREPRRRVW
jgi:hypothetical protein